MRIPSPFNHYPYSNTDLSLLLSIKQVPTLTMSELSSFLQGCYLWISGPYQECELTTDPISGYKNLTLPTYPKSSAALIWLVYNVRGEITPKISVLMQIMVNISKQHSYISQKNKINLRITVTHCSILMTLNES